METLLLDTGALYALADSDDSWHERVKVFLDQHLAAHLVPITVLPEVCYLLNSHLGQEAERAFLAACASVIAVAERLNVRQIVTVDRRDFALVRPRHCPAFALFP